VSLGSQSHEQTLYRHSHELTDTLRHSHVYKLRVSVGSQCLLALGAYVNSQCLWTRRLRVSVDNQSVSFSHFRKFRLVELEITFINSYRIPCVHMYGSRKIEYTNVIDRQTIEIQINRGTHR